MAGVVYVVLCLSVFMHSLFLSFIKKLYSEFLPHGKRVEFWTLNVPCGFTEELLLDFILESSELTKIQWRREGGSLLCDI